MALSSINPKRQTYIMSTRVHKSRQTTLFTLGFFMIFTGIVGVAQLAWQPGPILPSRASLSDMVFDGRRFLAVDWQGFILASDNGSDWSVVSASKKDVLHGIVQGNKIYVAVGNNGSIWTSPDLSIWSQRSSDSFEYHFYDITYGDGVFAAVRSDGSIHTSEDGISWPKRYVAHKGWPWYAGIAYGRDTFVAVGSVYKFEECTHEDHDCDDDFKTWGTIITSHDRGLTWTQRDSEITTSLFNVVLTDIEYGNNRFVAIGSSVFVSEDGLRWSQHDHGIPTSLDNLIIRDITFGNGQFVAVGRFGEVITSIDGKTWIHENPEIHTDLYAAAVGNGVIAVAGAETSVRPDGQPTAPKITQITESRVTRQGQDTHLQVFAVGAGPLNYRWRLDGRTISGTNDSVLRIINPNPSNQGSYSVTVWNDFGRVVGPEIPVIIINPDEDPDSQCLPSPSEIIHWWTGDDSGQDLIQGSEAVSRNGADYASAWMGNGFSLDGKNDFFEILDVADLDQLQEITISFWMKPTRFGGRLVDKITPGKSDGFLVDLPGDRIRFILRNHVIVGSTPISTDRFTYVVCTFDGEAMSIYLNGKLDFNRRARTLIPVNNLPLRIGASSHGVNNFSGLIDELSIYSRALSAAKIANLYSTGEFGMCKSVTIKNISRAQEESFRVLLYGKTGTRIELQKSDDLVRWKKYKEIPYFRGVEFINGLIEKGSGSQFYRIREIR